MFGCFRTPKHKASKAEKANKPATDAQKETFKIPNYITVDLIPRTASYHTRALQDKDQRRRLKEERRAAIERGKEQLAQRVMNNGLRIQARREQLPEEVLPCLDWRGYLMVPQYSGADWEHMQPHNDAELAHSGQLLSFVLLWSQTLSDVILAERAPALDGVQASQFVIPEGEQWVAAPTLSSWLSVSPLVCVAFTPETFTNELPVMQDYIEVNMNFLLQAGLNTVYFDAAFNDAFVALERGTPDFVASQDDKRMCMLELARGAEQENKRVRMLRRLADSGVRLLPVCSMPALVTARDFSQVDGNEFVRLAGMAPAAVATYFDQMVTVKTLMENLEMLDIINQDMRAHPDTHALLLVDSLHFEDNEGEGAPGLSTWLPFPTLHAGEDFVSARALGITQIASSETGGALHFELSTHQHDAPSEDGSD